MNIFKFEPIYMQRVWGGNTLKKFIKESFSLPLKKLVNPGKLLIEMMLHQSFRMAKIGASH